MASIDFFTVPTATFRILLVFLVLRHDRRRVVHFNITEFPSAAWTAQQIIEAFPEDTAPKYLIRDHDGIYGHDFCHRVGNMGIEEVLTAPPISKPQGRSGVPMSCPAGNGQADGPMGTGLTPFPGDSAARTQ